jgi:hypothetical protein
MKKNKPVIVEVRYTDAFFLKVFPLWGNWNKWNSYRDEKTANEVILVLTRKAKGLEFRIKPDD